MTLIQPDTNPGAVTGNSALPTRGLAARMAAIVAGSSDSMAGGPVRLLVRRLLPVDRLSEAEEYERLLIDRVAARMEACRLDMVRSRLSGAPADVVERLETDAIDLDASMATLMKGLDVASALFLLNDTELWSDAGSLLSNTLPDLREAVLDAASPGTGPSRFDALCQSACVAQIRTAIGRLPLGATERQALRRLLGEEKEPAQEARPLSGEPAFMAALRRGDHFAAVTVISASALIPAELVETAISLRNRRGLVSLAWKAGFSMQAAVLLQSQVAGIAPDALLSATADGGCPLGRSEMVWQIGLLARMPP